MLDTPCLKLGDINRIGQSPRRLIGKVWPARVTQHVNDVLPAELFWSHDYHQPCLGLTSPERRCQAGGGP